MKIRFFEKPIPHATIEDFIAPDDLQTLFREISGLHNANLLLGPNDIGSAQVVDENERYPKRDGLGAFIDNIYGPHRENSQILQITQSIFSIDIVDELKNQGDWFLSSSIQRSNRHWTLLNYYPDGGEYLSHSDESPLSAIISIIDPEQTYDGGKFIFSDYDYEVLIPPNGLLLFPGWASHAVTKVTCISNSENSQLPSGRFSIAVFIHQMTQ